MLDEAKIIEELNDLKPSELARLYVDCIEVAPNYAAWVARALTINQGELETIKMLVKAAMNKVGSEG